LDDPDRHLCPAIDNLQIPGGRFGRLDCGHTTISQLAVVSSCALGDNGTTASHENSRDDHRRSFPTGLGLVQRSGRTFLQERDDTMRILIVEDDYLVADQLAREILELGEVVVGPYANLEEGAMNFDDVDAAILDVRLGDGTSFHIADSLQALQIPFLFYTGYDPQLVPSRFCPTDVYNKPGHARWLLSGLRSRQEEGRTPPAETIESVVREMLVQARRMMPDKASAERLVEAALKVAIETTERDDSPHKLKSWLMELLTREFQTRHGDHLN